MFRLALSLLLTPLLVTSCLAQQFPIMPGGELPIAAIELDKMPWTKIPGIGSQQEFATIVGDRAKPGLYIQLVRWPPHAVLKAHSHPDDRYVIVLLARSIMATPKNSTRANWKSGQRVAFSPSQKVFVILE